MSEIQIFCGTGSGKSAAALGQAVSWACHGKSVFIVRFLKGKAGAEQEFMKRLEPEIKLFTFEHYDGCYEQLTLEKRLAEQQNIRNELGFARKVMVTNECDLLILDEILGLVAMDIISAQEVMELLKDAGEDMHITLTGTTCCDELRDMADLVHEVTDSSHGSR
ncbi:MAG: cob(I)yrinic acid a,c-diamide adenosyltransferase [Lachnospiraceae bacterium]|nr:cob(I)yrinic acid a,c-diamide adenosyltransferase [Lachnospiraceae bacterium]